MILDEATSSIDTRTEAIVQRGMDALMQGRTVFVIAHRLSTVRNSDVIMVLEQGHIIERGSHDKLIEEKRKILSAIYRSFRTGVAQEKTSGAEGGICFFQALHEQTACVSEAVKARQRGFASRKKQEKPRDAEGGICFFQALHEQTACVSRR